MPTSKLALRRGFPAWNNRPSVLSASARTEGVRSSPNGMTGAVATRLLIVLRVTKSIIKLIRSSTLIMSQLTPQRDSRALTASSTASGSAFYDTRDPPSDGAGVRGKDMGWQMAHVTDYRVRVAASTVGFAERLARFRYNREFKIERGKSTMTPRTSVAIPKTSLMTLRTSVVTPRPSLMVPGTS
jgi:hypothetical protein